MLSPEPQDRLGAELLRLARGSIEHGLAHGQPLPVRCDELPATLAELRATFTTLRLAGELRGCCGTLEAARPLAADVAHSAFQAAFRDPRFAPVGTDELHIVRLEVAVLSPPQCTGYCCPPPHIRVDAERAKTHACPSPSASSRTSNTQRL